LNAYLAHVNEGLKSRRVHWEVEPQQARYLHLCVDYPESYNSKGAWVQLLGKQMRFVQQDGNQ